MEHAKSKKDEISVYIEDQESVANMYVMRCFFVMLVVFTIAFILNLAGIFVIDQKLMIRAYIPSVLIYGLVYAVTRFISLSDRRTKYFILFCVVTVLTIMGVFITYHVVLTSLLPILYAMLYSSKKIMRYVYCLTVVSTFVVVYGGYYFGLCDANMALLTTNSLQGHLVDGNFTLIEVNSNPAITLLLFYVVPRCLTYIAFVAVCSSIYRIVNGSLEKLKLTAELEKAKEEAERANHAKSQFLARVSHEIRTPINAVLGMNEMILRESREEETVQYAKDVKDSSMMLLNIVNDILDSSKIESGMMELIPVKYELGSLLNDLYNMISLKAKEKGLELIFDISPELPCGYIGDDKRIRQILLNLLTNAVKYTEYGSVKLQMNGRIQGEEAVLQCSVIDTGIGIKQEDMEAVQQMYCRVDVQRNRTIEGTGLGLNIVRQFLELMGSELRIHSEYEKGSVFSFELIQPIEDKTPLGDFRARIQKTDSVYRSNYTAPGARVLVVDDYKMNLKVFKGLLKQTKMQVFEAESGQECLKMLETNAFDIIFLDHMMPGLDGIETLHIMKERKLCEGVPVVMLTANSLKGDKEKYLREGFDDFLSKPIIPEKLDRMLRSYLPERLVFSAEKEDSGVTKSLTLSYLRSRLPEINYEEGMLLCREDEAFYLELFHEFTKLKIKEVLEDCKEKGDYTNYCIHVHGFKNNAYSVGAKAVGDLAYEMEQLTRECMPEEIDEKQRCLFALYDRICEEYNAIEQYNTETERTVEEKEQELREQQKNVKELFLQTVMALSEAVEAKDRYTSGHSKRVAEYSRMLAVRLGKGKAEQEEIYQAGLLHDVGKIRIPEGIINKEGKLTEEEFSIIKIHPVTGFQILRGISNNSFIAIAAKYHHERYDGRGYPNGLAGDKIPEVARILCVADSYDAMTSNRSYRKALPQAVVREEIEKGKGTQFDPKIAEVMLQLIDEDKEYRMQQNDSMQRRVLVVDDEPMNHKLIAHIMKDEPMYEIVSASSGTEALELMSRQAYDLILLDVKMPEMDGLETLQHIREKYKTPVVFMTGDKNFDMPMEYSKLSYDDYITKPFLPLLMKEIVHNMTRG